MHSLHTPNYKLDMKTRCMFEEMMKMSHRYFVESLHIHSSTACDAIRLPAIHVQRPQNKLYGILKTKTIKRTVFCCASVIAIAAHQNVQEVRENIECATCVKTCIFMNEILESCLYCFTT